MSRTSHRLSGSTLQPGTTGTRGRHRHRYIPLQVLFPRSHEAGGSGSKQSEECVPTPRSCGHQDRQRQRRDVREVGDLDGAHDSLYNGPTWPLPSQPTAALPAHDATYVTPNRGYSDTLRADYSFGSNNEIFDRPELSWSPTEVNRTNQTSMWERIGGWVDSDYAGLLGPTPGMVPPETQHLSQNGSTGTHVPSKLDGLQHRTLKPRKSILKRRESPPSPELFTHRNNESLPGPRASRHSRRSLPPAAGPSEPPERPDPFRRPRLPLSARVSNEDVTCTPPGSPTIRRVVSSRQSSGIEQGWLSATSTPRQSAETAPRQSLSSAPEARPSTETGPSSVAAPRLSISSQAPVSNSSDTVRNSTETNSSRRSYASARSGSSTVVDERPTSSVTRTSRDSMFGEEFEEKASAGEVRKSRRKFLEKRKA